MRTARCGDDGWARWPAAAIVGALAVLAAILVIALPASARAASVAPPALGTTQTVAAASTLADVACPTASTCYAVGTGTDADGDIDGVVVPIVSGVAGTPVPVPGGGATELGLTAISCPTSSTCYAVGAELAPAAATDSGAEVVTISSGVPSAAVPAAPSSSDESYAMFNDIACASATSCIAVGTETSADGVVSSGASSLVSSGVPGVLQADPDVQSLNGDWCSGSSCQAGASIASPSGDGSTTGALVALSDAAAPGAPQPLTSLAGVGFGACTDATGDCLALGYTGADATDEVLVPVTSQTAGAPVAAPNLLAIACPSSSSCVGAGATDDDAGVVTAIANGAPGSPVTDTDTSVDGFDGVACATATSCVAVGVGDDDATGVVVGITLPAVAPPPGTTTPPGSGSGKPTHPKAKPPHIAVSDVTVTGSRVSLKLSCSTASRCVGAVTEAVTRAVTVKGKREARSLRLGRDRYAIRAGHHLTKTVVLNPTGRRLLAAAPATGLHVRLSVTLGAAKRPASWHRAVTLHARSAR